MLFRSPQINVNPGINTVPTTVGGIARPGNGGLIEKSPRGSHIVPAVFIGRLAAEVRAFFGKIYRRIECAYGKRVQIRLDCFGKFRAV